MGETIKKTICETGTKIQTETSKFATDHEEEINKVKKRLSETKTKAEESKLGKKVKESADKFAQDHEEGITKNKLLLQVPVLNPTKKQQQIQHRNREISPWIKKKIKMMMTVILKKQQKILLMS